MLRKGHEASTIFRKCLEAQFKIEMEMLVDRCKVVLWWIKGIKRAFLRGSWRAGSVTGGKGVGKGSSFVWLRMKRQKMEKERMEGQGREGIQR